jgi:hypothetical protein
MEAVASALGIIVKLSTVVLVVTEEAVAVVEDMAVVVVDTLLVSSTISKPFLQFPSWFNSIIKDSKN